jgi:hypothetical protein
VPREIELPAKGKIISLPQVGGLHYRYLGRHKSVKKSKPQQQVAASDRQLVETAIYSSDSGGPQKISR